MISTSFKFWIGFTTFLFINFMTAGLQNLRDGFLVDYFSTKRNITGLWYGLVQAAYGIGFGVALALNIMSTKLQIGWTIKNSFLLTVVAKILLNVLMGAGEYLQNNVLFVTVDFIWRFLLGAVSFKNQLLFTEMTDLWFGRRRDLFLGIVFTARFAGSATAQYTGCLFYVKFGYFFSFLIHGAITAPLLIPGFLFIADPEDSNHPTETRPFVRNESNSKEERKNSNSSLPTETSPMVDNESAGEDENLNYTSYLLLITLFALVCPFGIYCVLVTPYFLWCCNMPVDSASSYLTVMTATTAVSFTVVGWVLQHVPCFLVLLASCAVLVISPLLVFLKISRTVSVSGIVLYGIFGPIGILSVLPSMETTHLKCSKSQTLSPKVKNQVNSLYLGVWSVGGNCVTILAGLAMDYLTFTQIGLSSSGLEVVGVIVVIVVIICNAVRQR